MSRRTLFIFCVLCGILLNLPSWSSAQEEKKAIDPKADRILRQMSEYLNTLEQLTIHIDNTVDTLLSSGQKVQLGRAGDRPVSAQDDLAKQSQNPVAKLISVPFENNTYFEVGPNEEWANVFLMKPVYPVNLGKWNLINRFIMPVIYQEERWRGKTASSGWGT